MDASQEKITWGNILLSIYVWAAMAGITIFFNLLGLLSFPLTVWFDRKGFTAHALARGWGAAILAVSPVWRLEIKGLETLDRDRHYVIVANHQSILDILVAVGNLPLQFKFMSKKEVFRVPFAGWHMALARYIAIDRADTGSRKKALQQAETWLEKGVSVLFFPEGTRSPDGRIHDFKPGAFAAAVRTRTPVLPIVIDGTGRSIPKKGWIMKGLNPIVLSVGRPVEVGETSSMDDLKKQVRDEMSARLEAMRGLRPA